MYQKTVEKEEGYSKAEIEAIKKALDGIKNAGRSKSVQDYTKKLLKELKG